MLPSFQRDILTKMIRVFDLGAVCVSFLGAFAISFGSYTWPSLADVLIIRIKVANLLLFVGYLAICSAVFSACGFYRSHRLSHWKQRLYEILLAVTLVTGILLPLKWIFDLSFATNVFLLVFWLFTFCILVLSHEITYLLLHFAYLRGRNMRNVIIVGEGPDAIALASHIKQEITLRYRVLGIIDARELMENGRFGGDF